MRAMVTTSLTALALAGISLAPMVAAAHVGVSSGPGFANTTQEISFGVGHGCEGSDTYSVRVEIPAGVTSVRATNSDFGKATVVKDAAGNVTAVEWQKSPEDVLPGDTNYYKLTIRAKIPNQPFTTIYFPTHQTCRSGDGGLLSTDWVGTPQSAAAADGGMEEPAPSLLVLPARRTGWNKVTVPQAIASLSPYFDDAQIVWKGNAAHSANGATLEQIKATAGVTVLTTLAAGDEIWVKY